MTTIEQYKIQDPLPSEVLEWLGHEEVGDRYKLAGMDVSPQDMTIEREEILSWLKAKLSNLKLELTFSQQTLANQGATEDQKELAKIVVTGHPDRIRRYESLIRILEQQSVAQPEALPSPSSPASPWSAAPAPTQTLTPSQSPTRAPTPVPSSAPAPAPVVRAPAVAAQVSAEEASTGSVLLVDTDGDRYIDRLYGADGKPLAYSPDVLKECFARLPRGATRVSVNTKVEDYIEAYRHYDVAGLGPDYQTVTRSMTVWGEAAREAGVADGEAVEYLSMQAVYANIVIFAVREAGVSSRLIPRERRAYLELATELIPDPPAVLEKPSTPETREEQVLLNVPYEASDPREKIKNSFRVLKKELAKDDRAMLSLSPTAPSSHAGSRDVTYVAGIPQQAIQRSSKHNPYIPPLPDFALSALRMIDQRAKEIQEAHPDDLHQYRKRAAKMVADWYNQRIAEGLLLYHEMNEGESFSVQQTQYEALVHGVVAAAFTEIPSSVTRHLSIASPTAFHPYPKLVVSEDFE